MAKDAPRASRPHIAGYGIPKSGAGMLRWDEVACVFAAAPRYWISTTGSDGAPHVIQQWGAFIEGILYFEGGSHTRFERLTPDSALANAIIAAYATKPYGYTPETKSWEGDGLVAVRPVTVFAWKFESFNTTATRFTFGV